MSELVIAFAASAPSLKAICMRQRGEREMSSTVKAQPDIATRSIAGVLVPDTPLISRAIEYAREHSEPYLFNHVMRSWLFAATLAQLNQTAHDGEVLAVTTILHDLGLAEGFKGLLRFEVEGANAARAFARHEGLDDRRAQLIWDGVALNSTPSIALYKEAEIALATLMVPKKGSL